jgi:hypothetical protein
MYIIRIIVALVIGIVINSNAMEIDQTIHKTPASLVDLCVETVAGLTLSLGNDDYNKIILQKIPVNHLRSAVSQQRKYMLKGKEIISEQTIKKIFKQKYRKKIPFFNVKETLSQSNTYAETQDKAVQIKLIQPNADESYIILESTKDIKAIKGNYIQSIGLTENPLLIWAIERKGHKKYHARISDETSSHYEMAPFYCDEKSHKPAYDITCYNDNGLFLGRYKSLFYDELPIFKTDIIKNGTSIAWFIRNGNSVEQYEYNLTKLQQLRSDTKKISLNELRNIGLHSSLNDNNEIKPTKKQKTH